MPRTYVRKTERGSWTKEQMDEAVAIVRSGTFTGYEVSLRYNIPRSTLMDHVSGRHGRKSQSMGKPMALPQPIEENIADNLKYMEMHGFKFTKKEILQLIGDYVKTCKITSPFRSGCPGDDWYVAFAARNSLKRPQAEKKDFSDFKEYFTLLKGIIQEFNLGEDPGKIWYFDETSFNLAEDKATRTNKNQDKNVTVLTACNAEGDKAPVLIVFKDTNKQRDFITTDTACYTVTENGRLGRTEFREYFSKKFLTYLKNVPPILLVYNGRLSHVDIQLIEEARRANIIFLKIPKLLKFHSIFNSLKFQWDSNLLNLKSDEESLEKDFSAIVVSDFEKHETEDLKNGFRKAGLYPFDDSVTEDKYDADFMQRYAEYERKRIEDEANKETDEANDSPADAVPEEESILPDNDVPVVKVKIEPVEAVAGGSGSYDVWGNLKETVDILPSKLRKFLDQEDNSVTEELPSNLRRFLDEDDRDPGYGDILDAATTIREPTTVCCVFGCRNSVRLNPDKEFFAFPGEPARYLNWLKLINREDLVDKLSAGKTEHRVCSDHFEDGDFDGQELNEEAVPQLKLPTKSDNVLFVNCGEELGEIKTEPPDEMEVEIHFEPEAPPTVKFNEPVMPKITHYTHTPMHVDNVNVPALPAIQVNKNTNRFDPKPPMIQHDEIPPFQMSRTLASSTGIRNPISIENVNIPAITVNKNLFGAKPVDPLRKQFFKNATISCIEHISLPIEGTEADVERKSVVTQTTKDLIDKMNAPLKKKHENELKEANKKLKEVEEACKNPRMDQKKFIESCDKFLDERIANIVKSHATLLDKSKGNRYSYNFKAFALNLYLCSPQSYKFVEQFFYLPCMTTINRLQMPVRTGINKNLIISLKLKVDQMSEKEKMCTVCFDYMDVNKNLYYDVKHDLICGLHEIDQVQGTAAANYAPVIMVRGLYTKWKQPVSFALVAEKICYPELKQWLIQTIAMMFEIGLNVRAFTVNQETEFLDLSDVSVTESYFEVNGRKIYLIYDVPFLFKSARDDFLKYDFHFGSKVAKMDHVLQVYDTDKNQELRLMPKITDQHVRPAGESDNDVRLSIELFSRAVAAALNFHVIAKAVPKKTNDTVEFIQTMNNLFDILNSQKQTGENEFKRAYKGTTEQNQFLGNTLEYLQHLQMKDEYGNVIEKKNFVTGLLITIKSVVGLIEDLQQENCKYILTKNLSKDCMEGYFKRVRLLAGTTHARPTSIMFARSFKRLFLMNLVANTKTGGTEVDLKATLSKISDYVQLDVDWKKEDEEQNRSLSVGVIDYQQLWPVPSTTFITGYLLWKCLEKHKCEPLIETLCRQYNVAIDAEALLEKLKEYNGKNLKKKGLVTPPTYLVEFVQRLEQIFTACSGIPGVDTFGFGGIIYSKMECEAFEMPCECFPLKFMKYLFIRLKIFHMVKEYNNKNKPKRFRVKK